MAFSSNSCLMLVWRSCFIHHECAHLRELHRCIVLVLMFLDMSVTRRKAADAKNAKRRTLTSLAHVPAKKINQEPWAANFLFPCLLSPPTRLCASSMQRHDASRPQQQWTTAWYGNTVQHGRSTVTAMRTKGSFSRGTRITSRTCSLTTMKDDHSMGLY